MGSIVPKDDRFQYQAVVYETTTIMMSGRRDQSRRAIFELSLQHDGFVDSVEAGLSDHDHHHLPPRSLNTKWIVDSF